MIEDKHYLFKLSSDDTFETISNNFKEAIILFLKHDGVYKEIYKNCLEGFDDNDINGLVEICNCFNIFNAITTVYEIGKVVYE